MIFFMFLNKNFIKIELLFRKVPRTVVIEWKIEFTKDHYKIVEKLIEELNLPKTLDYPDFLLLFTVYCVASKKGFSDNNPVS